ncbi:MAG TPA: VWA domain-containing protein [Solirubrobacteraceae bacterium]|nr:VWA domain-containing protein [Solirubrobacteraceae bacterium]
MSFERPLLLIALVAIPLAIWWYARAQRGREGFASPALVPAVAPHRPGWRRHWPMALYALGLAGLILAIAKPQRAVSVPVDRASVLLVTDRSGSMQAEDVDPNRLVAARRAAEQFLDEVPSRVRVGLVAFNQGAEVAQLPTADHGLVRDALAAVTPAGGTATGDALTTALRVLRPDANDRRPPPAAIVLLSDGKSVKGRDPVEAAREARRLRVPVYTVALGTDEGTIRVRERGGNVRVERVPPDRETLKRIADASGGETFAVEDAEKLEAVYERLGSQVATKREKREITTTFAGGALLLVLAGGGLSLAWFGRLP